jgi:hypothetical protein
LHFVVKPTMAHSWVIKAGSVFHRNLSKHVCSISETSVMTVGHFGMFTDVIRWFNIHLCNKAKKSFFLSELEFSGRGAAEA